MFLFDYFFLFGNLALLCIQSTHTIILDIPCKQNDQCGGIGALCRNGKCQCDTPYYTPCGTTKCEVQEKYFYEGENCRIDSNCIDNAICNRTDNQCHCIQDYVAMNGLCYKNLNVHCMDSSECWSRECRDKICQCPIGSTLQGDNRRCQRKLPSIYPNWTLANDANDFCYGNDQYSCLVPSAICQNDSEHSEKFCQCPSTHIADYEKQECHLREYNGLSPSIVPLPASPCGKCQVENALCVDVANQATCWCRAGFINSGNRCVKSGKILIFPNQNDIELHDYISNCWRSKINGLCNCLSGEQFIDRNRSCHSIKPHWENDEFEYGICTRINSNGYPMQEHGLCPYPLQCLARKDKYVCSCGQNRYLNEKDNTCYYFLEKYLTNPIANDCPLNSILNNSKCQCSPSNIFQISEDSKYCELKLNGTSNIKDELLCNTISLTGDLICEQIYGGNARFCRKGECRCQNDLSYDDNNKNCITLIGAKVGIDGICPMNAENSSNLCVCQNGYRVENSTNRTCVRKVNNLNQQTFDLTINDCDALFPNQPIQINGNSCQCQSEAFFNGSICILYLNISFPNANQAICPTNAEWISNHCQCSAGYKQFDNKTCNRWTDKVYPHNVTANENLMGIKDEDCKALFGSAAEKSNNTNFCRCREANISYFNANNCYFLVNTIVDQINFEWSCPLNSIKNDTHCDCQPGYKPMFNHQGCEIKSISTSKLQAIHIESYGNVCDSIYTNQDCQVFFGSAAVCRNNQCYCDRKRSFVRNNYCVLFSDLIFPGVHERHLYTCNTREDCGIDAEKNGINCEFIDRNYRVCQCQQGYFFNPINFTCVENQCYPSCSNNQICENYQCICPVGFYQNSSGQCVKFIENLNIHDGCNASYWSGSTDGELECSIECERVRCSLGYEDNGSKCVKKDVNSRCVNHKNLCSVLNSGLICNQDENKCVCEHHYYQIDQTKTCIRAIGSSCIHSLDCGEFGQCLNKICVCKTNGKEKNVNDYFGQKIKICVNGINQLRFDFLLFIFFVVIVRMLFV